MTVKYSTKAVAKVKPEKQIQAFFVTKELFTYVYFNTYCFEHIVI